MARVVTADRVVYDHRKMLEPSVEIAILAPAAADDARLMAAVTELVNDVYAASEHGLWVDGATRTNLGEVQAIARAGELVVARAATALVGTVRFRQLAAELSEFGMLTAAPGHRGTGVGRRLVEFVERRSLEAGRTTMQLELLVPRTWSHPSKQFLATWYGRIGYRRVRAGLIEETHPLLAPLLATPCDLDVYHKALRP